ncbi:PucR family transcriptional regulator [Streptococcus sp. A23]|uniref:PucR family transcriptional regulator n=1 Tax=Streptococcus TaxID=1301 RepID=UPI000CF48156|nr:PucR family transcriptional regulator ligand-binding domain-containing protein [Streptococcus suis]
MLLSELLTQNTYKEAKILTPSLSLDRAIESVMVIEALDIERWAVKNQILLTSFVAFQSKSLNDIEHFFTNVSKIGISGIFIKTKRIIEFVPDFFIRLCQDYNIPLVEISYTTSYESIILSIHEPLLNNDSFLLRSYYNASRVLNRFTNLNYTYENLFTSFVDLIGLPFSITIPELNLHFSSANFHNEESCLYTETHIRNSFTHNRYVLRQIKTNRKEETYYLLLDGTEKSLRFELILSLHSPTIDHSIILILEKFIEVLLLKLDTDYHRKNEVFLHRNKTVSSILFGIVKDEYELDGLLHDIHLHSHDYYQVLLATFPTNASKADIQIIKKWFEALSTQNIYYESNYTLVYLLNIPTTESALRKEQLLGILDRLPMVHYYLSQAGPSTQIHENFSTCINMKEFNDVFSLGKVLVKNDLGIFDYFINIPPDKYDQLIPQNLQELFQHKYELFETFQCFIINQLNYGTTARQLFLHPKTIRYRINKVKELLNIDLSNHVQLINYTIGCILLTMSHKK